MSAGEDLVRRTLSETIAPHERVKQANLQRGLKTLALTGGGAIGKATDTHLNVASDSAARVQEVHRTLLHAICELVERGLFP